MLGAAPSLRADTRVRYGVSRRHPLLTPRAGSTSRPIAGRDRRARLLGSYEPELGRQRARLVVRALLALPGDDDSRYRMEDLDRLVAEDPAAARAAMEIARRLAGELGVALHPSG